MQPTIIFTLALMVCLLLVSVQGASLKREFGLNQLDNNHAVEVMRRLSNSEWSNQRRRAMNQNLKREDIDWGCLAKCLFPTAAEPCDEDCK